MNIPISINAIKIRQQIGEFFVAKIKASDLVKITYSDVRELQQEREVETYLGIQRPLSEARAKEIQDYVKNYDATFPSSVILHINQDFIEWDEFNLVLKIDVGGAESPAKILDGQHRIAGFMDLKTGKPLLNVCQFDRNGEIFDFEFIITIFIGLDLSEQANIFSTVNLKHTKVGKSLVYDLESYTKTRSPQKTAHEIVVTLDQNKSSPFYGRVKRLGFKNGNEENLTQAMLVEEILKLISKDPMKDRDILIRQEKKSFSSFRKAELEVYPIADGKVYRDFFIKDDDKFIILSIIAFFKSVTKKWPQSWLVSNKKSVLNKTVGVKALFRILKYILVNEMKSSEDIEEQAVKVEFYNKWLDRVEIDDNYFSELDAVSVSEGKIFNAIKDSF